MSFKTVGRRRDDDQGFTLIELLVVVIIIGIIAAIAIPVFLSQRQRGWRAAVQSDLRNFAIVAETHLTDEGTYVGIEGLTPDTSEDVTVTVVEATAETYCLEGSHANHDEEVWSLRPGGAGLAEAACTAPDPAP